MFFYKCEFCGANLDPGEQCDCKEERELKRKRVEKNIEEFQSLLRVEQNGQLKMAV